MTANPVSPDSSRRHSKSGGEASKRKQSPTVIDWDVVIERFKADMKRRYR